MDKTFAKSILMTLSVLCAFIIILEIIGISNNLIKLDSEKVLLKQQLDDCQKENTDLKKALKEAQGNTPGINQSHLRGIINSTLAYLGEKNIKDWSKLVCLTIATESNMGKYTKQLKGPAKGITQVEPTTEKYALKWLAKHDKKMFSLLKTLRVPANVGIHEAEYNLAYSIGLAYSVYRMKGVNPVGKSTEDLAKLYKKYYNTSKGKATVDNVLTKLVAYGVKL